MRVGGISQQPARGAVTIGALVRNTVLLAFGKGRDRAPQAAALSHAAVAQRNACRCLYLRITWKRAVRFYGCLARSIYRARGQPFRSASGCHEVSPSVHRKVPERQYRALGSVLGGELAGENRQTRSTSRRGVHRIREEEVLWTFICSGRAVAC